MAWTLAMHNGTFNRGGLASSRTQYTQSSCHRANAAYTPSRRKHQPYSRQHVSQASSSRDASPSAVEELQQMSELDAQAYEEELGQAWREQFEGDLDSLYDFADRGHLEYAARVKAVEDTPRAIRDAIGVTEQLKKVPAGMATDLIGMGTWRMKGLVDPAIEFLVGRIEGSLRELLPDDLSLYPPERWKAQGWDFVDSVDPQREWDGWAYVDIPDPDKGEEGYPRLQIENRIYCSRVFRKLHLEVAWRQDGLHVLHLVFFPRYDFDVPILAMDLVVVNGTVTLAIADACPVSDDLSLPHHYLSTMHKLREHFLAPMMALRDEQQQGEGATAWSSSGEESGSDDMSSSGYESHRNVPAWGAKIFSPACVCIRPQGVEELAGFIKYAIALTRAHLLYAQMLAPIKPTSKAAVRKLEELTRCHKRFCEHQLSNKKTLRVLEVAFGEEMASRYMNEIMFDYNPQDQPPWFDASISRLYEHFEERPEVWPDAGRFLRAKAELDGSKAYGYVRAFLEGKLKSTWGRGPGGPKLEQALTWMWENDAEFRAAAAKLAPGIEAAEAQGAIGPVLAEVLAEVLGLDGRVGGDGNQAGGQPADAAKEPAAAGGSTS